MRTLLWVVLVLDQLFILAIAGVRLDQFDQNEFVFKQQLALQSGAAAKQYRKLYNQLPQIRLLQMIELIIATLILAALFIHLTNPVLGVLYTILALVIIKLITRLNFVGDVSTKLFIKSLDFILKTVSFFEPVLIIIGLPTRKEAIHPQSIEEFTDLLRRMPSTVLSPLRRQRLEGVLESEEKTVKDIMTKKKSAVMVEPSATLGPIVLSDLQKSGHGYFPVSTKKGEPQGILKLSDISDLQTAKQRSLVREQMSSHISWVGEATTLYELAAVMIKEKQYLLLVRNENEEFRGLVTMADLMKHVLGIVKD